MLLRCSSMLCAKNLRMSIWIIIHLKILTLCYHFSRVAVILSYTVIFCYLRRWKRTILLAGVISLVTRNLWSDSQFEWYIQTSDRNCPSQESLKPKSITILVILSDFIPVTRRFLGWSNHIVIIDVFSNNKNLIKFIHCCLRFQFLCMWMWRSMLQIALKYPLIYNIILYCFILIRFNAPHCRCYVFGDKSCVTIFWIK